MKISHKENIVSGKSRQWRRWGKLLVAAVFVVVVGKQAEG